MSRERSLKVPFEEKVPAIPGLTVQEVLSRRFGVLICAQQHHPGYGRNVDYCAHPECIVLSVLNR